MFKVALYEPEIPPNTGNIIRLCANTGCQLHLIHPLGFDVNEKQLRRAGMDYRDLAHVVEHPSYEAFSHTLPGVRLFACSTKGTQTYSEINYRPNDIFLFGPESRGLPEHLLKGLPDEQVIRIPMRTHSRSLNLSNAVAVMIYEAWRQNEFK